MNEVLVFLQTLASLLLGGVLAAIAAMGALGALCFIVVEALWYVERRWK